MRNDSLRTKEGRLQARAAVLENLRKDGAKVVEHKDADCITVWHEKDGRITIRLYSGTAYQPDIYEAYHVRSREYAQEKLTKAVQNREQRRKSALDQRGKRTPSPQAQTAAAATVQITMAMPPETSFSPGTQVNRQLRIRARITVMRTGFSCRAGGTTMAMNMP